jgi:hypothetical protein
MAQYIKNADLFGRIGSGIGQGLAEQFPKEMERGRLASGLKNFEQEHANLNPMQQLARLSAIPGITPQMIQSFSELAKHQNQGNAYRNSIGEMGRKASPDLTEIKQAALLDRASSNGIPMEQGVNAQSLANNQTVPIENNQRTPNLGRVEDIPQVAQGNPLNQQNLSRPRWTPQQRNALVADYISQGFLPDKAQQLAADDEAIYLGEP